MFFDGLVRFGHHGNEHVEKNDHAGDVEGAVDEIADDLCEFLVEVLELNTVFLCQSEQGPEDCFERRRHSNRNGDKRPMLMANAGEYVRAEELLCWQFIVFWMWSDFDFISHGSLVVPEEIVQAEHKSEEDDQENNDEFADVLERERRVQFEWCSIRTAIIRPSEICKGPKC